MINEEAEKANAAMIMTMTAKNDEEVSRWGMETKYWVWLIGSSHGLNRKIKCEKKKVAGARKDSVSLQLETIFLKINLLTMDCLSIYQIKTKYTDLSKKIKIIRYLGRWMHKNVALEG